MTSYDIRFLEPKEMMNDALMDFCVHFKVDSNPGAGQRIHYFDSMYSRALVEPDQKSSLRVGKLKLEKVPKNLFNRKIILLPFYADTHWSGIAWVDFHTMKDEIPKSKILVFDSMKDYHKHTTLLDEWKTHICNFYLYSFNIPEDGKEKIRSRFNSVEIIRCCKVCDSLL